MIRQRYDPNQNSFCSINFELENSAFGSFINHYRTHHNSNITRLYEEVESDTSDHYTEIRFDDELINFR